MLAALSVAGCTPKVPQELAGARRAYEHARTSDAASLAPAELHVASRALAAAEHAFEEDPKDFSTVDLSYVAHRKAQLAEAQAAVKRSEDASAAAAEALSAERGAQLASSRDELASSQDELASSQSRLEASERATREAMKALSTLAAVQEEERGTVITLSGSVLFTSGESTLLPAAQTKLDQVAAALVSVKERPLVVEGHTDSQGSDEDNLALSLRRAEAVRSYLVSRGCDASLTKASGIGEGRPIADNDTPEGRANNRRVELVVEHAGAH